MSILIYIIIAVVAIYNAVTSYQKEQAKNKKRAEDINRQPIPTTRPFENKNISLNIPNGTNEDNRYEDNVRPSHDLNRDREVYKNSSTYKEKSYTSEENLYNSKDIESIIARIENSSDANEKQAFLLESGDVAKNSNNRTFDLGLNSPEDYRRAFIHTLIFEKKY